MSRGQHAQANGHPKFGGRGGRTDSKLRKGGLRPIDLRRLEQLLAEKNLPPGQTDKRQARIDR